MQTLKKSIPATEMKNRFGDYLGEVLRKHEPIIIEKHGKAVAVLVALTEWDKKTSISSDSEDYEDPWIVSLKKIHQRMKKHKPHTKKFSAVELIRQIREESL